MPEQNFTEFMNCYNPDGTHPVTVIEAETGDGRDASPFIVISADAGRRIVIVNPLAFDDHLCVDLHPFVKGDDATAGVFGMTEGRRVSLPADTGTTSHGWPSANMIAVLVGEQARVGRDALPPTAERLRHALDCVVKNGARYNAAEDEIIEAAARAYLRTITT
jgi:hypothetical protein